MINRDELNKEAESYSDEIYEKAKEEHPDNKWKPYDEGYCDAAGVVAEEAFKDGAMWAELKFIGDKNTIIDPRQAKLIRNFLADAIIASIDRQEKAYPNHNQILDGMFTVLGVIERKLGELYD